jgi:hypothetical protein
MHKIKAKFYFIVSLRHSYVSSRKGPVMSLYLLNLVSPTNMENKYYRMDLIAGYMELT